MKRLKDDGFADVGTAMSAIVALVVLMIGIFVFFTVIQNITPAPTDVGITNQSQPNETEKTIKEALGNVTDMGNSIFNILGIVMVIGVIMAIVGVVYNYVGPSSRDYDDYSSTSHRYSDEPSPTFEPPAIETIEEHELSETDKEVLKIEKEEQSKQKQWKEDYKKYYSDRDSRIGRAKKMMDEKEK